MIAKLKQISKYLSTHFSKKSDVFKDEKWKQAEALVLQMMALRVYKEVVYRNIPFPQEDIDETMRKDDFELLKDKMKQLDINTPLNDACLSITRFGTTVSNAYTQELRLAVAKKGDKSPLSLWTDPLNVSQLFQEFRIVIAQRIKTLRLGYEAIAKGDLSKLDWSIKGSRFRSQVVFRNGANQFQPFYVGELITLLNKHHKPDEPNTRYIERYCDPCAGWGDRLVGAFAAAETLGLKSYVGTDPNVKLQTAYKGLIKDHKPEGFEAVVYDKPIEDCTPEELMPGGKKNQLLMTCPPYFSLELYEGEKQSTTKYPEYENWKEHFLYKLAITIVDVGGYVSYIVGEDKKNNIPEDLECYMKSCTYLKVLCNLILGSNSGHTVKLCFSVQN